ncbi:MAG: HAD-IA family hydrolase, partial [Terriglobales bacterium]
MPQPPLVVFDLDGVLVDVSGSYRVAIRETVAALGGGAVAPEAVQALKNAGGYNNDWDLSRELLRRRGIAVPLPRVVEVFNQKYLGPCGDGEGGLIQQESWLLQSDLLAALRQRFRLAIFTGRPRADADYVLRRFAADGAFDHVVALEDVSVQKPDPEGLFELRRLHAPAPLAAYIGDSIDDARAAAAAEVPFIAIVDAAPPEREERIALFRASGCQFVDGGTSDSSDPSDSNDSSGIVADVSA